MKELGIEIRCYHADSKGHKTTDSECLQGGMMDVITCKPKFNSTSALENR